MNKFSDLILNHRILRKLVEMNLITQSEVRRLIIEELTPDEIASINNAPDKKTARAAYRVLSKKYHPDLHPDKPDATKDMAQATDLYKAKLQALEAGQGAAPQEAVKSYAQVIKTYEKLYNTLNVLVKQYAEDPVKFYSDATYAEISKSLNEQLLFEEVELSGNETEDVKRIAKTLEQIKAQIQASLKKRMASAQKKIEEQEGEKQYKTSIEKRINGAIQRLNQKDPKKLAKDIKKGLKTGDLSFLNQKMFKQLTPEQKELVSRLASDWLNRYEIKKRGGTTRGDLLGNASIRKAIKDLVKSGDTEKLTAYVKKLQANFKRGSNGTKVFDQSDDEEAKKRALSYIEDVILQRDTVKRIIDMSKTDGTAVTIKTKGGDVVRVSQEDRVETIQLFNLVQKFVKVYSLLFKYIRKSKALQGDANKEAQALGVQPAVVQQLVQLDVKAPAPLLPFKEPPALPAPKDELEQVLPDDEDDPTMPALPGPVTDTGEEPVEEPVEEPGEEPAPQEDPVADADNAPLLFDPDTRNIQKLMVAYQNFVKEFYNKAYLSEQGELIKDFVRELKDQVTGELDRKAAFARAGVGKRPEMNLAEEENPQDQENKKEEPVYTKRLPNFKADTRTFYDDVVTSQKMLKIFSTAASQGKNIGDTYKKRLIRQITDLQDATGQLAIDIDKLLSEQGEEATIQEQTAAEQLNAAQEVEAAYDKIRELFDSIYQQLEKLRAEQEAASPEPAPKQADTGETKEEPKQADAEKAEKEPEVVAEFKNYKYKTKISLKDIQSAAKEIIGVLDKVSPYFPNVKPFSGKVDFDKLEEEYAKAVSALDFTVSNLRTLNKDTVAKGTLVSLRRKLKTFSEELSRIFDINPKVPDAKPANKEEPAAEGDPDQQPGGKAEEEATDEEVQKFLADNKDFYELALRTYLPALEKYMQGGSGLISERNDLMNNINIIKKERKFIEQNFPVFQEKLKASPEQGEKEAAELQDIGEKLSKSVADYIKAYDTINEKSEDGNLDQLRRGDASNMEKIKELQTEVREHVQFYDAFFKIVKALMLAKEIDEKTLAGQWEALQNAYNKKIPDRIKMLALKIRKNSRQVHRSFDKLTVAASPILRSAAAGFLRQAGKLADKFGNFFAGAARRAGEELQRQQSTDKLDIDPENMGVRGGLTEEEENKISKEDYVSIVNDFREMCSEFLGGYIELKKFSDNTPPELEQKNIDAGQIDLYFKGVMKQESQIRRLLTQNDKQIKKIERFASEYEEQIVQHVGLFGLKDNAEESAEEAAKDEEGEEKPESLELGSPDKIEDPYIMGMNSLKELLGRLDKEDDPINASLEKMTQIVSAALDDMYGKMKTLKEETRPFKDIDDFRKHVKNSLSNLIARFDYSQKTGEDIMGFKKSYNKLRTIVFKGAEKTLVDPDAATKVDTDFQGGERKGDTIPPGDVALNLAQTKIIQKAANDGLNKAKKQNPDASQEELIKKAEEIAMSDEDIEKVGDELEKDIPKDLDSDDVVLDQVKKALDKIEDDLGKQSSDLDEFGKLIKDTFGEEAPQVPDDKAEEAAENIAGEKNQIAPLAPEDAKTVISTEIDNVVPELPPETKKKIVKKVQQKLKSADKKPKPKRIKKIKKIIKSEIPEAEPEKVEQAATEFDSILNDPDAEEEEVDVDVVFDDVELEATPEQAGEIEDKIQALDDSPIEGDNILEKIASAAVKYNLPEEYKKEVDAEIENIKADGGLDKVPRMRPLYVMDRFIMGFTDDYGKAIEIDKKAYDEIYDLFDEVIQQSKEINSAFIVDRLYPGSSFYVAGKHQIEDSPDFGEEYSDKIIAIEKIGIVNKTGYPSRNGHVIVGR